MLQIVATALSKRAIAAAKDDQIPTHQLPAWSWIIIFIDFILFVPIVFYLSYTLNNLFPVLAMVEDPNPPAYEPVSLNEDNQSIVDDGIGGALADESARNAGAEPQHITSSIRRIEKTLRGISGWRSYFRGFGCFMALTFSTMFVYGAISSVPFVPGIVASAVSALVLVQLYTAWTHIVISSPSPKRFWQRLPPFKQAFHATALPTMVYFVALEISQWVPKFLANVIGLPLPDPTNPYNVPQVGPQDSWKGFVVFVVSLILTVFLVIPSHVVLTRVQASMLPDEDDTIVPFDRSFQNKVEPAIVGGKGFVTMKDAWDTFERAAWVRLVKLYLKIFFLSFVAYLLMFAVIIPEVIIFMKIAQRKTN